MQQVECESLGCPVYKNESTVENALVYEKNGKRVELTLVHLPGQEPTVHSALFEENSDPDAVPLDQQEFTLDEARLRLAFFNQLKKNGLL